MRPLSTAELLATWERGLPQTPQRRALTLLLAACPGATGDELGAESVGRRDARLLQLREWSFGERLRGLTDCPRCGEVVELAFAANDIRAPAALAPFDATRQLEVAGWRLRWRLPTAGDLVALESEREPGAARRALLRRCLVEVAGPGGADDAAALPAPVAETVV